MVLFFIGLVLFIMSMLLGKDPVLGRHLPKVKLVSIVLIMVGLLLSTIKQVDPGEVGVQSLFGKVDKNILESGLNIVNPLVDVTFFNTKTQNYTMSSVHDEGEKQGDDAIRVLSSDGLEVIIDATVLYKIIPTKAPNILQEIGKDYTNLIVRPMVRTKIRDKAVYYDAVSLYSTKRDEFQNKIFEAVKNEFTSRGLDLEALMVRNIVLPASVKTTIESKINAEQEAQKMQFVLQKEKQEAERKRVEAQGIADYQRIMSAGLSEKQLEYERIKANKEIATSTNAKVIIMGNSKGSPLIISDK